MFPSRHLAGLVVPNQILDKAQVLRESIGVSAGSRHKTSDRRISLSVPFKVSPDLLAFSCSENSGVHASSPRREKEKDHAYK
jgi:hypothetical protein